MVQLLASRYEERGDYTYMDAEPELLDYFAKLVAEECAKVCDDLAGKHGTERKDFAAAIRAKFGGKV